VEGEPGGTTLSARKVPVIRSVDMARAQARDRSVFADRAIPDGSAIELRVEPRNWSRQTRSGWSPMGWCATSSGPVIPSLLAAGSVTPRCKAGRMTALRGTKP
jgi:hypothetical protein